MDLQEALEEYAVAIIFNKGSDARTKALAKLDEAIKLQKVESAILIQQALHSLMGKKAQSNNNSTPRPFNGKPRTNKDKSSLMPVDLRLFC
ncbi:hypothetical protein L3V83_04180 [Thiotrichales bacterium 19X7-9]|nr:hypothetical protein [Thiotrichales bacterium 19X7-9]